MAQQNIYIQLVETENGQTSSGSRGDWGGGGGEVFSTRLEGATKDNPEALMGDQASGAQLCIMRNVHRLVLPRRLYIHNGVNQQNKAESFFPQNFGQDE